MRGRYDQYYDEGEISDRSDPYCSKPAKRTRVQGNKKRIITSTADAPKRQKQSITIEPRGRPGLRRYVEPERYQSRDRSIYGTGLRPTYPKINRKHVDERTLLYYDLPFEVSRDDPEYLIIRRQMDSRECEVLFEHTKRMRGAHDARTESPASRVRPSPHRFPPPPRRETINVYNERTVYPRSRTYTRKYDRPASRSSSRGASEHGRSRRRRTPSPGELIDRQAEEIDVIEYRDFEPRRDRKQAEDGEDFGRVRARSEEARRSNGGAKDSDAEEEEEEDDVESDLGSDDGWNYEFDLSFLPSIHSDDSAEKDISNGSTNALLLSGHRQDHVQRRGPLLEKHIASTRWTGSTFDDSTFGADVFTLSSPPTKLQKPMLRWTHLERPMPSFEEFSSTASEVLEVTTKSRRHVGDVLRKLQRTNEQQRQQGRDMKPFCEADIDIEERGDQTQQTSSICALSIPFFCLEKSTVNQLKSLASGSLEHPSRPLVQSHTRMLNETRELAQAVTTLGSTPQNHYLHVSQLWCLLVNDDTLVTCSRSPISQLSNTLSFTETAEKFSDTVLRLRAGHTRRWHLPSTIATSLPSFFSMITDQFSNILGSRPEVEMNYHGKPIRFSNWKNLVDDIFKTKSEVKLTGGLGYARRSAQSHVQQHFKNVAGIQPYTQRQESSNEPATAATQPLSRDVELSATPLPAVAEGIMVFFHSGGGSPKALSKLATNLHQTLCSVQHKIIRESYSACAELDRSAIESWLDEQNATDGVKRGPKHSRNAQTMKSQKILTARLALYIFDFFWPKDFDHIVTRKFWGALHGVLAGDTFFGNGAVSKSKDLEMSRDLLETLTDCIFEFVYSFTTAFAGQEVELNALPEQFFKAWLYVVSTFTITANIRPKSTYDERWVLPQKQIFSAKRALQEGEAVLTTRLRKANLEDFEVCSSRGIVALMLDCVTRDIMHGRPDVSQTYSDYCKQLEAKIVAEPLSRSHQETLRALQQEIEAITTVLTQQLEVVTYFESSIRDLDCGDRLPDLPILRSSRQDLVLRQCKANINSRLDQFEALQGRATELGEWHMSEIDTNKDRQEAAIMVFTIVTIIFLPLSFVSSVFGMNTEDIRDMTQGQWAYWAAAVPLTIVVVGVSLWFAGAFDNNVKSWFTRSTTRSKSGSHDYPIAGISEIKPRLYDEKPMLYPGVRKRTTYPRKHSYV